MMRQTDCILGEIFRKGSVSDGIFWSVGGWGGAPVERGDVQMEVGGSFGIRERGNRWDSIFPPELKQA